MLEQLSDRLGKALKYLKGEGSITESNLQNALREIRLSLLEGDVNFRVVKDFTARIKEQCLGQEVQKSLNPFQHVVKVVRTELEQLLGGQWQPLSTKGHPTVIMLIGLQGAGKTTTVGKLAGMLKKEGKTPLVASMDLKRLAAVEQLEHIAASLGVAHVRVEGKNPKSMAESLLSHAREYGYDTLLVDTAGRLHLDDALMDELVTVKGVLNPQETVMVADALTGQDAVQSAQTFAGRVGFESIILTKMDADARGGAALSMVAVTGKPIKYVGMGEKSTDLERFHPDRMASRILGMGDVLSLIEKAEQTFDEQEARKVAEKMRRQEFSLDDFAAQLRQVQKMGSVRDLVGMMPGMGAAGDMAGLDDRKLAHVLAIIQSMTPTERNRPKVIDGRRRLRISRGSGRPVQEINQLLRQFQEMQRFMKKPMFRRLLKGFDKSPKIR